MHPVVPRVPAKFLPRAVDIPHDAAEPKDAVLVLMGILLYSYSDPCVVRAETVYRHPVNAAELQAHEMQPRESVEARGGVRRERWAAQLNRRLAPEPVGKVDVAHPTELRAVLGGQAAIQNRAHQVINEAGVSGLDLHAVERIEQRHVPEISGAGQNGEGIRHHVFRGLLRVPDGESHQGAFAGGDIQERPVEGRSGGEENRALRGRKAIRIAAGAAECGGIAYPEWAIEPEAAGGEEDHAAARGRHVIESALDGAAGVGTAGRVRAPARVRGDRGGNHRLAMDIQEGGGRQRRRSSGNAAYCHGGKDEKERAHRQDRRVIHSDSSSGRLRHNSDGWSEAF